MLILVPSGSGADVGEVLRTPAERELVLLRPQEVAEQRVRGVDPDAAVDLLRGGGDPRARLGGPELGDPSSRLAGRCSASSHAACHIVHRIASTSMNASAMRCWTA